MNRNFKKRMKRTESGHTRSVSGKKRKKYDGIGPNSMPDEFFAQKEIRDSAGRLIASEGDFNLSQVRGEQARRYFEKLGLPMPPGVTRMIPKIR